MMILVRGPVFLTRGLALLMLAQGLTGLLLRDRYRDADWIRATWFGNDWVTLVVALPLMLTAAARARAGSVRGLLLWLGLLGYAVYNYAFYLFGAALNVFFPLYVASVVLAAVSLILALSTLDAGSVADAFEAAAPVRLVGGVLVAIGSGLAVV